MQRDQIEQTSSITSVSPSSLHPQPSPIIIWQLSQLRSAHLFGIKESARQGLDMAQVCCNRYSIHGTHLGLFTALKCNKICNRIRMNRLSKPHKEIISDFASGRAILPFPRAFNWSINKIWIIVDSNRRFR